ncbi:hypothetical protein BC827DRAFT_93726 [Russula dissimulans]|nr:hypothetical protein BC827DRAFT_93726 [Russula dissimulans]
MSSTVLPKHAQILVIGGGPGGSYAATALAREGFDVVLFEAAVFPRYHIGESLLPSVRHHLKFIDCEKKVVDFKFNRKPGAAVKFNQFKQEAYTDFVAVGPENSSWNVTRSEFDKILLDHAVVEGVKVFQSTKVTSLDFSGERPIAAHYTHGPSSQNGTITFDYVLDASGRAGVIANRYLKNRQYNSTLKNVASWAYYRNVGVYGVGTSAEGAPYFEALTDESGWAWFIPLKDGVVSVGIVRHQTSFNESVRTHTNDSAAETTGTEQRYHKALELAPTLKKLMGPNAKLQRADPDSETVRTASDYSYSATSYAGERFRLVGDAAAFIDPFFSSGVHLAMTGGIAAAASVAASIRGDCTEAEAVAWHSERVNISYTRFLVVVLGAYKQIRSQSENVLSDVGENNFDKAFSFLRPVIQGSADFGVRLAEDEVQNALDFCADIFAPVNNDIENALYKHLQNQSGNPYLTVVPDGKAEDTTNESIANALLSPTAPPMAQKDVKDIADKIVAAGEIGSGENVAEQTGFVLGRINSRRIIHREYSGMHSLEEEAFAGYSVRLERGKLGLVSKATASA